jgi:hypothetical protein
MLYILTSGWELWTITQRLLCKKQNKQTADGMTSEFPVSVHRSQSRSESGAGASAFRVPLPGFYLGVAAYSRLF